MEVRGREVEPRELFWGAVIALGVGWFFVVRRYDPVLAALAIPVEIVATYLLVRPHARPPDADDPDDEDG